MEFHFPSFANVDTRNCEVLVSIYGFVKITLRIELDSSRGFYCYRPLGNLILFYRKLQENNSSKKKGLFVKSNLLYIKSVKLIKKWLFVFGKWNFTFHHLPMCIHETVESESGISLSIICQCAYTKL